MQGQAVSLGILDKSECAFSHTLVTIARDPFAMPSHDWSPLAYAFDPRDFSESFRDAPRALIFRPPKKNFGGASK